MPRPARHRVHTVGELERRLLADTGTHGPDTTAFFKFADLSEAVMLPEAQRHQLLRAAASTGVIALHSWRALRAAGAPVTRLHPSLRALLPAVYANLHDQGVEPSELALLKPDYLRGLAHNRRLLEPGRAALEALRRHHVDVVVLGAPFGGPRPDRDWGRRGVRQLDVWVRPQSGATARQALAAAGWHRKPPSSFASPLPPSSTFVKGPYGRLCLRDGLMLPAASARHEHRVWEASIPLAIAGVSVRVLCPTDRLLWICGDAEMTRVYEDDPAYSWVVDAHATLCADEADIDWCRFMTQTADRGLTLGIHDRLSLLHDVVSAPVPEGVLSELARRLPQRPERLERAIVRRRDPRERRLLAVLGRCLRLRRWARYRHPALGLWRLLHDHWSVTSPGRDQAASGR